MQVIEKPWGKEEVIEINDKYMMKKLTMWKGHRCSLQFHNHKKETIYVLSGQLRIISGPDQNNLTGKIYTAGDDLDVLVAMNPAALKANKNWIKKGGTIIANIDSYEKRDLAKAGYEIWKEKSSNS